ncbi:MAG: nuclear transport factor 2 family protein [SAR324 cluster bacterium]|nr:nuclear transport factor 2 family protein [SAR324 cluster bacterium]MBF0351520.1 nuclear transport factor 2 family protein [SAR324 cluster bacterium]
MASHQIRLESFFKAIIQLDYEAISSFYSPEAVYSSPVFDKITGPEIHGMWRLVCEMSHEIDIKIGHIEVHDQECEVSWLLKYDIPVLKKIIEQPVHSIFKMDGNGIISHEDQYNFAQWSGMLLGHWGVTFGHLSLLQLFFRKVVRQVLLRDMRRWGD